MADILMIYNREVEAWVNNVAARIESTRATAQQALHETMELPYPLGSVFNAAGGVAVSAVVDSALVSLARALSREEKIPVETWLAWTREYVRVRSIGREDVPIETKRHRNEMLIQLSEAAFDAITNIEKDVKSIIPAKYLYPPPLRLLNRKLIIIFALQYAASQPA